ncbi:MAG: heparinase, partial [Novosphingobium sp.]
MTEADVPPADVLPALTPGEVIEPGRALALADFAPPAVGAGERLLRFAYRLGIPGAALSGHFGKAAKPRLLATVHNPLPGSRMAGTALRAGHFLVHGVKAPIAQVDFAGAARMAPPLERVVHSFALLADLDACCPLEQGSPVAERVLAALLNANPNPPARPGKGPAWMVGNAGTRLLGWLVHAPLILSGNDTALRGQVFA